MINNLFSQKLKVINIGLKSFKADLEMQGIKTIHINWKPPKIQNKNLLLYLDKIIENKEIEEANKKAIENIKKSHPLLIDIDNAINVIPNMAPNMILHAGPPITWENMPGPQKGAIIGAIIYEGWAQNEKDAIKLIKNKKIIFDCCHHHNAVGPMAGIISPSMPVHVIKNKVFDNYAYSTVNEGLGKVLRFGAFSKEVIEKLKWIEETYMPLLKKALKKIGEIDLKSIIAQSLHMGDECHNRNKASTALFFKEITTSINKIDESNIKKEEVFEFLRKNEHYFLNLSMAACKVSLDTARNIEKSTIVVAMCRNGYEFGLQVSGLGNKWFTAPSESIKGLYFPGYDEKDACPDLGDSAITETMGIGGFAMAAAPSIVQFVGGNVADAINFSKLMYNITTEKNNNYSIPNLEFNGTALGIDILKVLDTGILPIINTGIAHKEAGIGQIGAGIVNPPISCFEQALKYYYEKNK